MDLVINSSITHSALLVLPLAIAALLRWARCPGWPVVGGAVAGILLGPTILGRVAPDTFEARFVGGVEAREAMTALVRRHEADRLAAEAAGVEGDGIVEMIEANRAELRQPEATLRDARWAFQRPFRSYTSALIVLALGGAAIARERRAIAPAGAVAVSSIGLWSAILPGALACFASVWWWREDPAAALCAGAAVAIGPWLLTSGDAAAADEAESGGARRIELAGRVATVVALAAAGFALTRTVGPVHALWGAPLFASVIGWFAIARTAGQRAIARGVLDHAIVPSLAACVAIKIDCIAHFALAPVVVFVILSADGRWLGAFIGAMLPGARRGLRTMRLVLGSIDCGPTQLAVTAVAAHVGAVREEVVLALLLGAVMIEITAPARRTMAARLTEAEAELG